jgi:hypothetical protein
MIGLNGGFRASCTGPRFQPLLKIGRHGIQTLGSEESYKVFVRAKRPDSLDNEQEPVLCNLRFLDHQLLAVGFLPIDSYQSFARERPS